MVITGDGEQLMGLGGLATIAAAKPRNLTVVVIDNQHFGETGMQPSHTGRGVDLASVAGACGFPVTRTLHTAEEVEDLRIGLARAEGPCFVVIKVAAENPPRDAVHVKNRFRASRAAGEVT
jgi:thiamine pyrophosphate-dependent acetolactate synthase large subunit-like protein